MVLNSRRDVKNPVRAWRGEVALKLGTPSRRAFAGRMRELAANDPVLASLGRVAAG